MSTITLKRFILKVSADRKSFVVQRAALDSCFLDKWVHGGNMAATDPAESPPKGQKSPAEEVETAGLEKGAVEPGSPASNGDEAAFGKTSQSPGEQRAASAGTVRCVASHSEGRSGDGSDKTTCGFPDDTTSADKTTDTPGNDGWGFRWSETEEEDPVPKVQRQGSCGKLTFVMVYC